MEKEYEKIQASLKQDAMGSGGIGFISPGMLDAAGAEGLKSLSCRRRPRGGGPCEAWWRGSCRRDVKVLGSGGAFRTTVAYKQ